MRPRVKICGITAKQDALESLRLGADMLGIVFAPRSPRYLSPQEARRLVSASPPSAVFVGVFVDEDPQRILDIARSTGLKKIQLQGAESPETCRTLHVHGGMATIKAFRIDADFVRDPQQPEKYADVEAHLFDSKAAALEGGSGQHFDWQLLERIPRNRPRFLAGGLDENNIGEAIERVRPDGVDLSSSLAQRLDPRRKDFDTMARFFKAFENVTLEGCDP